MTIKNGDRVSTPRGPGTVDGDPADIQFKGRLVWVRLDRTGVTSA